MKRKNNFDNANKDDNRLDWWEILMELICLQDYIESIICNHMEQKIQNHVYV